MQASRHPLRIAAAIVASLLCFATAAADAAERQRVGLVLAGGGARGLAHIGVIRYMEERGIKVDAVAGTSMGSIIGGLYASGMNATQLEHVARTLDWRDAFTDSTERAKLPFRRKQDEWEFLAPMKLRFKDGKLRLPMGAVEGQHLNLTLHDLIAHVADVHDFDKLPIPYRAVAADIVTGEPVVIGHGDLAVAMRASMSIPGFFTPVDLDGKLLVDGGIAKNVPVDVVQGMGVDRLVVVDIGTPLAGREALTNVLSLVDQLTTIMTRTNSVQQLALMRPGDILVHPDLDTAGVATMSFEKYDEAIRLGYDAAKAMAPEFAQLEPGGVAVQFAGIPENRTEPVIAAVKVETDSESVPPALLRTMVAQHEGAPFDRNQLERDVQEIYGLSQFSRVDYVLEGDDDKGRTLVVRAKANPSGTNYLRFGVSWDQDSRGDSDFGVRASWRQNGINQLGGELYAAGQLGARPLLVAEWYQPVDVRRRFFVDAAYRYRERELKAVDDGAVIATASNDEHRVEFVGGITLGNKAAWRAGVFGADYNLDLDVAPRIFSSRDSQDAGWFTDMRWDTLDRAYFPGSGSRFDIRYTDASVDMGADVGYKSWQALGYTAFSFGRNTLSLAARGATLDPDTRFAPGTLAPQSFTLGGFLALSGRVRDSMAGNHLVLGDLVYYRRLNEQGLLPVDFPVYFGASLEAGNVWLDESDVSLDDLEYGGSVFLGVDSPIGPIYLGIGASEDDEQAVYLQIGQVFD